MLTVYTLEQQEQWDAVVRSFSQHDVYWLSGYVKAFQIHGDGEPLLFYYDDGMSRGINVVMKRDVALDQHFQGKLQKNHYFDFATPYGYGGWILEGQDPKALFQAYEERNRRHGIISEFVRFHPMLKNHDACIAEYEVVRLGEVVHIVLDSPESVWENITSKNRNMIRKAQKNGIRIYNGRSPELFRLFRQIYNKTMDKDHAEDYYYFGEGFYQSILEDLPHNAQIFYAVKDGMTIAMSIMLTENGRMNYHLSGNLREYSPLAPTNLLLYQAALWGLSNGCRTLYLGGGVGSGEDNLFRFKRAFNKGDLNSFYIGKRIFDQEKYNELLAIRGSGQNAFFPSYRG